MPKPGIPEAFKVLVKELQSLALDVKVLDKDGEEIDLRQSMDDDDNMGMTPIIDDAEEKPELVAIDSEFEDAFGIETPDVEDEDEDLFSQFTDFGLDDGDTTDGTDDEGLN